MAWLRLSVGLCNVHELARGTAPRSAASFSAQLAEFRKLGFTAVQFNDDDVVPGIGGCSATRILAIVRDVKRMLDDNGLAAEFVAPRLSPSSPRRSAALASTDHLERERALERTLLSVDLCRELGCDMIGLRGAHFGTPQSARSGGDTATARLADGVSRVLDYDSAVRICIEPATSRRALVPDAGRVLELAAETIDPSRVGAMVNGAQALRAGLDSAAEVALALRFDTLFSAQLSNRRRPMQNQIRVLLDHGYGRRGEFVGLGAGRTRTDVIDRRYRRLDDRVRTLRLLEREIAVGVIDAAGYAILRHGRTSESG